MRRVEPKVFLVAETKIDDEAEEEIRLVFDRVGQIARERWQNLFSDFKREEVKGIGEWTSENWKI